MADTGTDRDRGRTRREPGPGADRRERCRSLNKRLQTVLVRSRDDRQSDGALPLLPFPFVVTCTGCFTQLPCPQHMLLSACTCLCEHECHRVCDKQRQESLRYKHATGRLRHWRGVNASDRKQMTYLSLTDPSLLPHHYNGPDGEAVRIMADRRERMLHKDRLVANHAVAPHRNLQTANGLSMLLS